MKKVANTEERIAIVSGAMAAINSLRTLVEMEVADLELNTVAPAKPGKAVVASNKKTAVKMDDGSPATPLLLQIMELLDKPANKGVGKAASKPDEKGFRPRNGRMDIIRAVVEKMGVDTPTSELFAKVNEVSIARGLKPIQKTAFYTLVSEVRKQSV